MEKKYKSWQLEPQWNSGTKEKRVKELSVKNVLKTTLVAANVLQHMYVF